MFSGNGSRSGPGPNHETSPNHFAVPSSRRFAFETSFSHPIFSFSAQRNPSEEHLIVVDLSRGFIRTTFAEARDLAETGYLVLDLVGWQPTWDPPLQVPRREEIERDSFLGTQLEEVYDAEDAIEEGLNRHLDEEIYYDTGEKKFKWRRISDRKGKDGKNGNGDRKPDSDAGGSGAVSGVAVM